MKSAAKRSKTDNPDYRGLQHGAISVFILFHLIAITCWALPWNFPPVSEVKALVRPYMLWSGLFQSWDMFAPNPKSINSDVKALVITDHHHIKVWSFPKMEELGYRERYVEERYRKFAEVLPEPVNESLLPDVANHIARFFNTPADPPEKVMLIQFRADMKPWVDKAHEARPQPNIFYDGYIDPGDLR